MLREARIVMPYKHDSAVEHDNMRTALIQAFGGYTSTTGQGGWQDGQKLVIDKIWVYDIAIEADRDASWDKLFQIAMTAGRELKQEAVYIRYPDGSVDIASCSIAPTEKSHQVADKITLINEDTAPSVSSGAHYAVRPAPLGTKRLPQVGEVWRNRGGALVAVMSAATVLDGGYNVVTLSKSDTARNPGHVYLVDLDGHVHRDHSGAPGDLATAVTRFDQ